MQTSLMMRLMLKDIYVNRILITGSLAAVLVSLYVATLGTTGFNIGSVLFITTIIVMGIFVAMFGVVRERENKSWMFVLSLPVSTIQYFIAKLVAALISFLLVWGLSLLATILVIVLTDSLPNGLLPFIVLMMLFMFHNFAIFLAVALLTVSEAWVGATIVVTNTSTTLFIFYLAGLPSIQENMSGPVAVWSPVIFYIMCYELSVVVAALALAMFLQSRRQDFV